MMSRSLHTRHAQPGHVPRAATLPEHVVLLVRLHDVLLLHALEGEGGGGVTLALEIRASNEGSGRFHNHGEGPY